MSQSKFTASEREQDSSALPSPAPALTHAQNKSLVMDAICCAHGNAFLQTAKKLEKAELLRIVKANGRGKTAKYLECVA